MPVVVLRKSATLGPYLRATAGASPFLVIQWKQPQARSEPDPQFRRRKLRATREGAGRGQRTLPRRDWLKGVAEGRKPRRATSAGTASACLVSGVSPRQPLRALEVRGSLLAEVSWAPRLGGEKRTFRSTGVQPTTG